jgi:uncharacterized coiled-coil DUF342 family protein
MRSRICTPKRSTEEREEYMTTHQPKPIEECLQQIQEAREQIQQIQEALEEKPDRDDVENWASDLAFKIDEMHDDVTDLQGELAEVNAQVDDLYSEDR